jgi:hypothetical protein
MKPMSTQSFDDSFQFPMHSKQQIKIKCNNFPSLELENAQQMMQTESLPVKVSTQIWENCNLMKEPVSNDKAFSQTELTNGSSYGSQDKQDCCILSGMSAIN